MDQMTGTKRQFLNATRKATQLKPAVTQSPNNGNRSVGIFYVESATALKRPKTYIVLVFTNHGDRDYECDCRAGELGQPCYHAARVWQLARSEGGLTAVPNAW